MEAHVDKPALDLRDVTFTRAGSKLLEGIDLVVERGEHWALIGPNGAGKTTLLNLFGAVAFPTSGEVHVLGNKLGRVDLRELRRSIGHVNPRHQLGSNLSVEQVVLTGETGTTETLPRWEPSDEVRERAHLLMKTMGIDVDGPHWHTMSQGERGRTLIARALMPDPPLLLLDEPSTGLDVAAREQMIHTITDLPNAIPGITTVTVTHHFEELPASTTHAVLLRGGRVVAAGPAEETLTSERVTETFDHPIEVGRRGGRWFAVAR